MVEALKYTDKLYQALTAAPKLYFAFKHVESIFDHETGTLIEVPADPAVLVSEKPSKEELRALTNSFIQELRVNRYQFSNFNLYLKNLYDSFKSLVEKENYTVGDNVYSFRKEIEIFFDYHPEANPDPLHSYEKLPQKSLLEVESYCKFQEDLLKDILLWINKIAGYVFESEELNTYIKDQSDSRIFIAAGPDAISSYFSVLNQDTNEGRPILRDDDFKYFLGINFQGFSKIEQNRVLSFYLIKAKHMQYLVYKFYQQYSDIKEYSRTRWAELLKNTFPQQYKGDIDNIASNFKKDTTDAAKNKFEDLGLTLPE
ncbi:hypothetical protein OU798_08755 [Prolixibacteraceae bacterium Z1-6]|uniref:Uncharacterized protein n=1 Tax=Draconibacterium aestuarii TaxID=2998507 RepID=A0A9X3F623_9BACT|nr:hypothetical protein [Prolixibacteraceae bacterium Z1-6]